MAEWTAKVNGQPLVPEGIKRVISAFDRDAHPMGMLVSILGAMSAAYPEAGNIGDAQNRLSQMMRLLWQVPAVSAYIHRHRSGLPFIDPDPKLSYAGNFLRMLFAKDNGPYTPDPVLEEALDILFILHADHEQNCSTSTMRLVGSSHADPYASMAAAAAALYGPLHGGANEAVLKMLDVIGDRANVPAFIEQVKAGNGRLIGFGHRVYKSYDPRATLIKQVADSVFAETGLNPKLEIALELERIALEDEYFISRKLYPNVDFYSGLIYQAMGFPMDMFTVLFAIPRTAGWLTHWEELLLDKDQKISRPRQQYTGVAERNYTAVGDRV